ncbi:hypothetical protein EW146_g7605 [Bondarzewia mesenterica]|uniref:Uncharacterized protein n=1 Tax=Bondarzewia mesenterica TaxID=1095465 RepID=A0A4S4LKB7_9AGAM|nr:hypothetical protein EW146_g7605 [Bondarzewia mesenterica]
MRDDDIVSEHLSHHYNLSSPSPSLPLQPIDTSYYATPPVSLPPTSPLDSDQSSLDLSPRLHYTPFPSNFRLQPPAITTQVIICSTMAPSMPTHDDRTVPTFDTKQPRELCQYFTDLKFHFTHSELLAKYTEVAKTYEDFKSVIYRLYPKAEEDRKWSIADMDKLIGKHSRIGILSIGNLNHFPDDPYDIQEVYDVAQFVLHGTTLAVQPIDISSLPSIAPITSVIEVKTEDLMTIFKHITEIFVKAFSVTAPSVAMLDIICENTLRSKTIFTRASAGATLKAKSSHHLEYLFYEVPPHAKSAPVEPPCHIDPPVHPYAAAYDVTYVPPVDHAINEPPRPPVIKKQEPAYHTMALIYNEIVMKDVYDRAMSSPVMITQRELLSLSPEHNSGQAKILMQDNVLSFALDDLNLPCDIKDTSPDIITSSFVQIFY